MKNQILPKLALQFTQEHTVKHYMFGPANDNKYHPLGDVEIRVLDYEIAK
jgi:hypothetical protein